MIDSVVGPTEFVSAEHLLCSMVCNLPLIVQTVQKPFIKCEH